MSDWDGKAYNENGEPLFTAKQYRDECEADRQASEDAREYEMYDNPNVDYPEPSYEWEWVQELIEYISNSDWNKDSMLIENHVRYEVLNILTRYRNEIEELKQGDVYYQELRGANEEIARMNIIQGHYDSSWAIMRHMQDRNKQHRDILKELQKVHEAEIALIEHDNLIPLRQNREIIQLLPDGVWAKAYEQWMKQQKEEE